MSFITFISELLRMTLNFWIFGLYLPSAGVEGVCHLPVLCGAEDQIFSCVPSRQAMEETEAYPWPCSSIFLLPYFLPLGVAKAFAHSKACVVPRELYVQSICTLKVLELQDWKVDLEGVKERETVFGPSSCCTYLLVWLNWAHGYKSSSRCLLRYTQGNLYSLPVQLQLVHPSYTHSFCFMLCDSCRLIAETMCLYTARPA